MDFFSFFENYKCLEKPTLLKGIKIERKERMAFYLVLHEFKYTVVFIPVFEKLCSR
jgi:hypothetical protein